MYYKNLMERIDDVLYFERNKKLRQQMLTEFLTKPMEHPDLPNLQKNTVNYYRKMGLTPYDIHSVVNTLIKNHNFTY